MPFRPDGDDDPIDPRANPEDYGQGLDAEDDALRTPSDRHRGPRTADDRSKGLRPESTTADAMPFPEAAGFTGFGDGDSPSLDEGFSPEEKQGESDSYWQLSRSPLASLVFSLPLVLAYEGGVLLLGRGSPRNGADVWLRHLLDALGFGQYFLLPLLTVVGLLAWQHLSQDRWRFTSAVLPGMAAESVLWALVLIALGHLQQGLWPLADAGLQVGAAGRGIFSRVVGYCGAGLYEEVLFRLLMLPVAVGTLERLGWTTAAAGFWAVVFSSLLFSAAHYVGPLGDTFSLYSFTFRSVAGVFFAVLFLTRGFGIAAGTHFLYDLLVGLL